MLKDHVSHIDLDLGLLELVVKPLGLIFDHLASEQLHKLLLTNVREKLIVELTLINKFAAGKSAGQIYRPSELP